ncbi:hypothetical protein EG329_001514 [Mollisiaceae sp. DMI_Dod_QoI]|nr:hypothetical protein EG329_001514 [Helotiales sp. DMI_Dod_QoI]
MRRCHYRASIYYFATLYDKFYMGGRWDQYKVLVDMLIEKNTSRPLLSGVKADLERLRSIQHLIVDLDIFAAVPVDLWAEFPRLESLTIALDREYLDPYDVADTLYLIKPKKGTRLGNRAEWLYEKALISLKAAREKHPFQWRIPKIDVVAQLTNISAEDGIEEYDSDDGISQTSGDTYESEQNGELEDGFENGSEDDLEDELEDELEDGKEDEEEDDRSWYLQTAAQMTHAIPQSEFRTLKHKYQPSEKIGLGHWGWQPDREIKKNLGDFITDSETEFTEKYEYDSDSDSYY